MATSTFFFTSQVSFEHHSETSPNKVSVRYTFDVEDGTVLVSGVDSLIVHQKYFSGDDIEFQDTLELIYLTIENDISIQCDLDTELEFELI